LAVFRVRTAFSPPAPCCGGGNELAQVDVVVRLQGPVTNATGANLSSDVSKCLMCMYMLMS
jgi:hypothetical protein